MNSAQKVRLWSLGILQAILFFTIIAIDNSTHAAAVPAGVTAGTQSGSVSSVYVEVGFAVVLWVAIAVVGGFTLYRFLRPWQPGLAQPLMQPTYPSRQRSTPPPYEQGAHGWVPPQEGPQND
jgi:hypothetical protein